jgi:hypothetical protein
MNPIQTNEYKDEPNSVVLGNYSGHQNREIKSQKTKNYHEFFNNHYGRVSSSCPANGTRLVPLVGKDIYKSCINTR